MVLRFLYLFLFYVGKRVRSSSKRRNFRFACFARPIDNDLNTTLKHLNTKTL